MSGAVGGDARALGAIAEQLAGHGRALRRTGWDVQDSVHAFLRDTREVAPRISDHEAGFDEIRARIARVERLAETTAVVLARADDVCWRRWVPGFDRYGRYGGGEQLLRDTADGGSEASWWRRPVEVGGLLHDLNDTGALSRSVLARGATRTTTRLAGEASHLLGAATRGSAVMTGLRVEASALAQQAARVTTRASQVAEVVKGSAAVEIGGRALAVLGAGMSAVDWVETVTDPDATLEDVSVRSLHLAGSVAMIASGGPLLVAGAVVVAGVLVYENREAIASAARAGAEWVGDRAGAAAERVGAAVDATVDAVTDGVEAVGDAAEVMLDGARALLDGLF